MFEKIKAFFKNIWQKIQNFPRFMKEAFISWWNDICPKKEKTSKTENANYQYGNSQNSWNASNTGNTYYQNAQNNQTQNQEQQTNNEKKRTPIYTHIFDIVASLCFFFALVLILREEKLKIDIAIFLTIASPFFILLKLATIFTSRSPIKIVSVLLLALSALTWLLFEKYFIFFLIFIILLYLAFEFSCSFKLKTVLHKVILLAILFCIEYFLIHYAFVAELRRAVKQVFVILFC